MILQCNDLSVFDLVASYAQRHQKTLVHFNLDKYNSLDATKKATVTTYYTPIVDDYVMDIMKQGGLFNTISEIGEISKSQDDKSFLKGIYYEMIKLLPKSLKNKQPSKIRINKNKYAHIEIVAAFLSLKCLVLWS